MTTQTNPRLHEIRDNYKDYDWLYFILLGLVILGVGVALGANLFSGDDNGLSYTTNVYTELLSIVATIVVIDRINQYRDRQNLKRRLVREAGSRDNSTAVSAIDWLRAEGWLMGDKGVLKGADLHNADLAGANLSNTNLQGANLFCANLQGASLIDVNLEGSRLREANLERAELGCANLNNANLINANLKNIDWTMKRYAGEHLLFRMLTSLASAPTLPDGTLWTENTDMTRFTNINHSNFWKPS